MGSPKAPYLLRKRRIFYVRKRIPKELIGFYGRAFFQRSLRTSDRVLAVRLSSKIIADLEREWLEKLWELRGQQSVFEYLTEKPKALPKLSEAVTIYCEVKHKSDDKRFVRFTQRVVGEVVACAGDKAINGYTRSDALKFRQRLLARDVSHGTVKRNFECIRAVWNFAAREHGIDGTNPFANMNYGSAKAPKKRLAMPIANIRAVQTLCRNADDDIRWLIAVLSDTGMRLGEVAGLVRDDTMLDAPIPHVKLVEHPWRRLKTASSHREVPIVGEALWGLKRALSQSGSSFLFPRYCSTEECKADFASSALNKWLRQHVPSGCVVHSFRHSMRDRLRAVECPADIIDQIGGWQTAGVGQGYGKGYELDILYKWMSKISQPAG